MSFLLRTNVPDGVNVGRVKGFYVTYLADRDADGVPDEDHLDGDVTFTPKVNEMRWPTLEPPRTSVRSEIVCPIINGFIYPPGTSFEDADTTTKGVVLVATDQTLAEPNKVQYEVRVNLRGVLVNPPTKTINVPTGSALDLAVVVGEVTESATIKVVSSEDRIRAEAAADGAEAMRDEIQLWLDSANGAHPTFDPVAGEYTTGSIQRFLAAYRNALVYGIQIPKSTATACTKTGANAGIANPVPGVIGTPAIDPYTQHGPFLTVECNAWVDVDGWPHVTAIQGDPTFSRDGSNGDVWVMTPTLYWRMTDTEDDVNLEVSDSWQPGFLSQPKAFLPDGRRRPFMLYAKYPLSIKDGVARSVSGVAAQVRTVSHNTLITLCKNASTGYSGKSYAEDWYLKTMFLLKYATKNSQSVFAQATLHSQQHAPALAEVGVRRVVVTTAQAAAFPVGSAVMVGTNSPASTDRTVAQLYNVVDSAAITSKTDLDGGNTALNLDLPADIDTATTMLISTAPAHCGACDEVLGDGSPTNRLSGREPAVLQGIEFGHGFYETLGDIILSNVGDGWTPMMLADSKLAATSVTAAYTDPGVRIESTDNAWKYPLYPAVAGNGLLYGAGGYGGGSSSGMADGTYINPDSMIGTRQWLGLGALAGGGFAGLWFVGGIHALSSAYWYLGSRLSVVGRSRG